MAPLYSMGNMTSSAARVAQRHLIRTAARQIVAALPYIRTASAAQVRREITAEVLAAFGEGTFRTRTAGSFATRLKQLYNIFQQTPKAWEQFKHMLGMGGEGLMILARELPGKIKDMFAKARKFLTQLGGKLRNIPVIALYLDVLKATGTVAGQLAKLLNYLPESIRKIIRGIGSKAHSAAMFIDEWVSKHPVTTGVSMVVSAAIFGIIWMNVYEVSWDVPSIIKGFLGGYSWTELLHSLPESALGFMLSLMFPGIPTRILMKAVIPATLIARLAWLHHKGYLDYTPNKGIRVKWEALGGFPEGAPRVITF